MIIETPTYNKDIPLIEFKNNPAIACLTPPFMTLEEAEDALFLPPHFDEAERNYEGRWRKLVLPRLLNFYFPTKQSAEILMQTQLQVIDCYRERNPKDTAKKRQLSGDGRSKRQLDLIAGAHQIKPSTISMITGPSGMGKSMLVRQILRAIGHPCYHHTEFQGEKMSEVQILYLMRNVPDQCTPNAFCERFGEQVREITGEDLYGQLYGANNLKRYQYLSKLRLVVINNHVGVIIIDEIQNLAAKKSGINKQEVVEMIQNFRDELGVPVILVGTYGAADLFRSHASLAQRFTEGGYHDITPPTGVDDPDWQDFCEVAWGYQWLKKPIEITDNIKEVLFDCSQGITRIMLNIFIMAQMQAIDTEAETVDADLIRSIYNDRFSPIHGLINALRSKDEGQLRSYEELYLTAFTEMKLKDAQFNRFDELHKSLKVADDQKHGVIDQEPQSSSKPKPRKSKVSDEELHNAIMGESFGADGK
jgi:hypothetical protein